MKWYTYLALKQLFPSKRKITFFSAMSIFGVSLGVCVLFVVNSVMDGFQERIKNTIAKTQGDIQILSHDIIYNTNEVYDTLKNFSEIEIYIKENTIKLRRKKEITFVKIQ